jgi:hypothetical protein
MFTFSRLNDFILVLFSPWTQSKSQLKVKAKTEVLYRERVQRTNLVLTPRYVSLVLTRCRRDEYNRSASNSIQTARNFEFPKFAQVAEIYF